MGQVSPLKSDSLFLPSVLSSSERCHWSQPTCTHGELSSTFLRAEHLHKLFGILLREIGLFLLFIDSCTCLFISVWTHWYLFYTLAYNPILFKLLCCSNWIQGVLISERLGYWMVLAQERTSQPGDRVWCRGGRELLVLGGFHCVLCCSESRQLLLLTFWGGRRSGGTLPPTPFEELEKN